MLKTFFKTLRQYQLKYARFGALYAVLAAAAAAGSIISIRATGDMAQSAGTGGGMMRFLWVMAVAGLAQSAAEGALALMRQRAFGNAIYNIRKTFVTRLLRMPYRDFSARNSGEGASLFTNDAPLAAEFAATQFLAQVSQIVILAVSVAFMAYINWWLTLIFFALFPPLAWLQAKISAPLGRNSMEMSEKRAEFNAVVTDALQNPLTIKAYQLEGAVERRFDASFNEYIKVCRRSAMINGGLALSGVVLTLVPVFLLFLTACAVVINGGMTVSEFIALSIISTPVNNWLSMFAQDMGQLRKASASAMRVMEFAPDTADEDMKPDTTAGYAAVFDKVSFGYTEDTKIFDNVSFAVEKGSITAIAGASGCGKSTALKLLLGLYTPGGGKIALSSSHITYVPQDCYLLPVSIRENITGNLPCDEEKLRAACQNAGIYDYITGLPDGFDSVLTEAAANISGGQKQRLAMARAFYRDADVLLFDEATSALDPPTEAAVLDAFRRYIKDNGKTAVMVAHRQSVLDMADRVITLGGERS